MPKTTELQLHPKAEMAIEYFTPARQKKIWKAIEVLQKEGVKTPLLQIYPLTGMDKVFMMRVNRELRIIFSLQGKTLVIEDVFTRERLLRLKKLFNS